MTKRIAHGSLGIVLVGALAFGCAGGAHKPGAASGGAGSGAAAGSSAPAGQSGSPTGTASGAAGDGVTVVSGTGGDTGSGAAGAGVSTGQGGSSGSGPAGSGGSVVIGPNTPVGTCATGFSRCYGICMESALVDASCRPALCAGPTTSTPPARASITPRGFTWDVQTAGDMTTVKFAPGKPSLGLQPTLSVDLNYRVNGGPQTQVAAMTSDGNGGWTFQTNTLKANDDVDFFFHSKVAKQTIVNPGPDIQPLLDTMWFHQRIGMPRDPEPQYPIVSKLAGRFRDRHPNEERFDHFVDTYFSGPTFDMTVVDNGDSIDVTIAPQASMQVQAVDFKNYEAMGSGEGGALPSPTPLCYTPPAIAALGVRATPMGNSVWKGHLGNLSYGQLVDWELTFVRSRTYYTEWFQYYVGSGRLQPKVMHPWAHAAGDQSVTDVSTDEFGYAQHVPNLSPQELADFITGKVLFEADFQTHVGYNPPTTYDCPRGATPGTKIPTIVTPAPMSPMFSAGNAYTNMSLASIARPGFTQAACFTCHHLDGKGQPADDKGMGHTLLKLFSSTDGKTASADPTYGSILDTKNGASGAAEATPSITWQTVPGTYPDGTTYELRKPVIAAGTLRDGPLGASTHISARLPRPVFGLGLLEAVPTETILGLADPDDKNGDGISGRPNLVKDEKTGQTVLGRFGWKAAEPTLRNFVALAFVNDVGVTSPLYPKHQCGDNQTACKSAVAAATGPQLTDADLDHVESYLRHLSVPPRRNYNDPDAVAGMAIFAAIGCNRCHVPNLVTSANAPLASMRGTVIQPFSDLLLHDMGDGLADDAPIEEGTATGREWRTPPLWGNGTGPAVMYPAVDAFDPNSHLPPGGAWLHDGRARSIEEAVLWHGGEAKPMHDAFMGLSKTARGQLLKYVAYPFADPVPLRRCVPAAAYN
jgi:CxxC motif-containing protein (DUF1111 family)